MVWGMLSSRWSRERQRRLLDVMARQRLDAVVVGHRRHTYYLSAFWPFWLHESAVVLTADGRSLLIAATTPDDTAADDVMTFEANFYSTLRQEQPAVVAERAAAVLKGRGAKRVGIDASEVTSQLAMTMPGACVSIEPALWHLRRRKDEDELALMRKAIECCGAMYRRAREVIEPGVPETRVFAELHAAAVACAGEPLSALLGNDYACCEKGGPARGRATKAGELYILDLGPAYRGYFSDNARTIAVDRKPTAPQLEAHDALTKALKVVERLARPGVRCRDIFEAVHADLLDRTGGVGLTHHLGHGVGLQPHEYPHLNPNWDDVLMEGDVFTAEPGLYGPELNAGIRLENQYLVTTDGVENMTAFPLEL